MCHCSSTSCTWHSCLLDALYSCQSTPPEPLPSQVANLLSLPEQTRQLMIGLQQISKPTGNTISVLVLTKDESVDLPGCLESLSWSDDIHVLDSMSTDETAAIARDAGATVTQRPFDDWATHQNWALANIPFKHEWVYYSDADERVTSALVQQMQEVVPSTMHSAFRIPRRDYFRGRWLKHCIASPFNIRLFRVGSMQYDRLVNPVPVVSGTIGDLQAHFDHYPFSKGMTHWLAKHNNYSTLEAKQLNESINSWRPSLRLALTTSDINERRRHQKQTFYNLPCRPVVKFLYFYLLRLGFLDGRCGFDYCVLQSLYEYMISLKARELLERRFRE